MGRVHESDATWLTLTGHPGTSPGRLAKGIRKQGRYLRRQHQRELDAEVRRAARRQTRGGQTR